MQTAIDILKPLLIGDPEAEVRQKVIMGTVKGDMHDIGKNLVRIMLLGAGFEVVDLGVNVPPQRFLQTAREQEADIVCLSALLSSTMNNMQEVINLFRADAELAETRILIGGAPVSRDFAKTIGADGYAPSAPLAVNLVQSLSPA
jgi:5-methyltetrahydrofolate--homocysteine methyltransferase